MDNLQIQVFNSARLGDSNYLKKLIKDGVEINIQDERGFITPSLKFLKESFFPFIIQVNIKGFLALI
ncbi:hypothetical protein BH23BAC1_BH23BAC1_32680 [soil metagenome]